MLVKLTFKKMEDNKCRVIKEGRDIHFDSGYNGIIFNLHNDFPPDTEFTAFVKFGQGFAYILHDTVVLKQNFVSRITKTIRDNIPYRVY